MTKTHDVLTGGKDQRPCFGHFRRNRLLKSPICGSIGGLRGLRRPETIDTGIGYRRMASWYQYQMQQKKGRRVGTTFDEWIEKDFRHNWQTRRIAGSVDLDAAIDMIHTKGIFVGLVEFFDESMLMLKALVAKDLNIAYKRRRNVARATTIAQSLLESERERQMLIDANQVDLQLYEYVRSELLPGYRQEYGATLAADLARNRASPGRPNYLNVNLARLKHYLLVRPLPHLRRLGVKL